MLVLKLFQLICKLPGVKSGMMLASNTEAVVQREANSFFDAKPSAL